MIERIDFPTRIRFGSTVNPLGRVPRWEYEKGMPPCPAGTTVLIESIEVAGPATSDAVEAAYHNRDDSVIVQYRLENGNVYFCHLVDFSLGEAAIILQAVGALETNNSNTERHVALINKWAADFEAGVEKKWANRST